MSILFLVEKSRPAQMVGCRRRCMHFVHTSLLRDVGMCARHADAAARVSSMDIDASDRRTSPRRASRGSARAGVRFDASMLQRAKAQFDVLRALVYNRNDPEVLSQHWLMAQERSSVDEHDLQALVSAGNFGSLPPGALGTLRLVAMQLLVDEEGASERDARQLMSYASAVAELGADQASALRHEVRRAHGLLRRGRLLYRRRLPSGNLTRSMRAIADHVSSQGKRVHERGSDGNCGPRSLAFLLAHVGLLPTGEGHEYVRARIVAEARRQAVRRRRLANGLSIEESMLISSVTWNEGAVSSGEEYCMHMAKDGFYFDDVAFLLACHTFAITISALTALAQGVSRTLLSVPWVTPVVSAPLELAIDPDVHVCAVLADASMAEGGASPFAKNQKVNASTRAHAASIGQLGHAHPCLHPCLHARLERAHVTAQRRPSIARDVLRCLPAGDVHGCKRRGDACGRACSAPRLPSVVLHRETCNWAGTGDCGQSLAAC